MTLILFSPTMVVSKLREEEYLQFWEARHVYRFVAGVA
jgi:hypothetical protein